MMKDKKDKPLWVQIIIVAIIFGALGSILVMTTMAWQQPGNGNGPPTPRVEWVLKHHCPGGDCEKDCKQGMKPKHAESDWVEGPCPASPVEQPPTPAVATATSVPQPTSIPATWTPVPLPTDPPETLPPPATTAVPTENPTIESPPSVTATTSPPPAPTFNPTTAIWPPFTGPNESLEPDETEEVCDLCEAQEAKLWSEARWYNTISQFFEYLMDGWVPEFLNWTHRDQ